MKRIIDFLITIGMIIAIYSLLFSYQLTFNTNSSNQAPLYAFTLVSLIALSGGIIYTLSFPSKNIIWWNLLMVMLIMILPTTNCSSWGISNEHKCFVAALSIICSLKILSYNNYKLIALLFFAFLLVELTYALQQVYYNYSNEKLWLRVIGSFPNSSILSVYLIMHVPLLIFFLGEGILKKRMQRIGMYFILFLIIVIVFITKSRTGLICLCFSFSFAFYQKVKKKYTNKQLILFVLFIIFFYTTVYLLFTEKEMSTNGRFLILKISCKHIKEYFWFGTGLGRFTNLYPLWQQDYFKLHPNLYNNEFVVAGETYVAFNDILQFFVEIGFLRFAIFVIAMYKFFRLKSSYYTILILYIKLSVGIILISALTTYTFHITILLTFLALCISFSISISTKTEKGTFCINYLGLRKPFFLIMLGTTFFAIYKLAQESNAIYKWKLTKANVSIEEKYQLYFSAYSYLSTNGKFLKDYGKILFIKGEYQKAILIFQQSLLYYNNFETYELLALVYEYQGDLENAILQYQYLANYVPHKFTPKYKIFQLYLKSKKYKEAKKIGDILLSMPIKIPSQTIDDIKKEVSIFMNSKML